GRSIEYEQFRAKHKRQDLWSIGLKQLSEY
ncbi:MAG: hypothetical protein QOJ12_3260, partial [Thermoleophilales bacterium]|nr:hypothetical protein [Thermoleophilales bacterium]